MPLQTRASCLVYVTGTGRVVPRGDIASQLFVYAPPGAKITAFRPTKGPKRADLVTHDGLQATTWPLELAPGESVTADYVIESSQRVTRRDDSPHDAWSSGRSVQCFDFPMHGLAHTLCETDFF